MKTISLKGKKPMEMRNTNLEELFQGPSFEQLGQQLNVEANADLSSERAETQQLNRGLIKKKKPDYNLYNIYLTVQKLLDQCLPTVQELLTKNEDGSYTFTEAAEAIAATSPDNRLLMQQLEELFKEVDGEPDRLRKGFIKDKVIQNRYSRRGAEYAQQFENVGDKIFSLSTVCLNVQMLLNDLVSKYEAKEGEI